MIKSVSSCQSAVETLPPILKLYYYIYKKLAPISRVLVDLRCRFFVVMRLRRGMKLCMREKTDFEAANMLGNIISPEHLHL